jgi:hypothetical protein
MNYKFLFVALAVLLALAVSPVSAVGTYYESKVVPIDIVADYNNMPEAFYGTLVGRLACGDNVMTPEIGIRNVLDVNGTYTMFPINPDGTFEIVLAPGSYSLWIPDGNGGQPEWSHVTIATRQVSYPETRLLGHAYSSASSRVGIYPMTVSAWIDGCNVNLNGLKVVKDELVVVPESSKTVCKMVKIIDQQYVPEVPGIPAVTHTVTIIDVPASPAWDEVVVDTPAGSYRVLERDHRGKVKCTNHAEHGEGWHYQTSACTESYPAVTHVVHHPAVDARTHTVTIIDVPAIPAVPAIPETHHHEEQCTQVPVPSYSYWTYKVEGRVTVKSIDTVITNPNGIPLTGHVTVVVGYTVDKNFGKWLNTQQNLEERTKTFSATFDSVPGGNTFYDGDIVFSERINDAIIDEDHFPRVINSNIVTELPLGYYFK